MKRILSGIFAVVLILGLTACGGGEGEATFLAMDTYIRLSAHGGKAARAVEQGEEHMLELEQTLSRTVEGNAVSDINAVAGDWAEVDAVTGKLVQAAAEYTKITGGAFDVTIAPVVTAWGFTTDSRQVPSVEELQTLLAAVDGSALQ